LGFGETHVVGTLAKHNAPTVQRERAGPQNPSTPAEDSEAPPAHTGNLGNGNENGDANHRDADQHNEEQEQPRLYRKGKKYRAPKNGRKGPSMRTNLIKQHPAKYNRFATVSPTPFSESRQERRQNRGNQMAVPGRLKPTLQNLEGCGALAAGIQETRPPEGWVTCDPCYVLLGPRKTHPVTKQPLSGCAIAIHRTTPRGRIAVTSVSDRLTAARIDLSPQPIFLASIYAPTEFGPAAGKDESYSKLQELTLSTPADCTLLHAGDFNAKVGPSIEFRGVCGKNYPAEISDKGRRLPAHCMKFDLTLPNTNFQQRGARSWTA